MGRRRRTDLFGQPGVEVLTASPPVAQTPKARLDRAARGRRNPGPDRSFGPYLHHPSRGPRRPPPALGILTRSRQNDAPPTVDRGARDGAALQGVDISRATLR